MSAALPRRALLKGLSSAPLALAFTVAPASASALAGAPDAALVTQAARVVAMARLSLQAMNWVADAEARFEAAEPEAPMYPGVSGSPCRESDAEHMRAHLALALDCNADDVLDLYRARLAKVEAYDAECAALRLRFRCDAAEQVSNRADQRLIEATEILTSMRPASRDGVTAKARALLAIAEGPFKHCSMPLWMDDLAMSTIRDVIAIGGQS